MNRKVYQIIGLMSGSSLDGLDVAWCEFHWEDNKVSQWSIKSAQTIPYSDQWQNRLAQLPEQNALIYAKTHTYFGHYMGTLVNGFLEQFDESPDCIASHGHTIFHYPNQSMTAQIGDGATLAAITGLPVISDFRTHDVALGGEGTPLAPTVDHYLFSDYDFLINLGGIANLTHQGQGERVAFDISPCNQVLNALSNELGMPFDPDGKYARNGKVIQALYDKLKTYPFYKKGFPKSLDNSNIKKQFTPKVLAFDGNIEDKLHTCCVVFGEEIARNVNLLSKGIHSSIMISGGGAYNHFLIECIQRHLYEQHLIHPINDEVIAFKEALLMALLGLLRIENTPNCFKTITGASMDSIGGAIYQGTRKFI